MSPVYLIEASSSILKYESILFLQITCLNYTCTENGRLQNSMALCCGPQIDPMVYQKMKNWPYIY